MAEFAAGDFCYIYLCKFTDSNFCRRTMGLFRKDRQKCRFRWQLFSWELWSLEKSEIVRNLALALSGIIGIALLLWRAWAADRTARAALLQATIGLEQIGLVSKQIEVARRQSEAAVIQSEASRKQSDVAVRQAELASDRLIVEVLSKSVEQLGNDASTLLRTGAVHVLARIAEDSPRDHFLIVNLLSSHVRERAERKDRRYALSDRLGQLPAENLQDLSSWLLDDVLAWSLDSDDQIQFEIAKKKFQKFQDILPTEGFEVLMKLLEIEQSIPEWQKTRLASVSEDVQAAMTALGKRSRKLEPEVFPLVFDFTDLRGLNMTALDCRHFDFSHALLRKASFFRANVSHCHAVGADFSGLFASEATFDQSIFRFCSFRGAVLEGASFKEVRFQGVNLLGTVGLTQKQVESAYADELTKLPPEIRMRPLREIEPLQ